MKAPSPLTLRQAMEPQPVPIAHTLDRPPERWVYRWRGGYYCLGLYLNNTLAIDQSPFGTPNSPYTHEGTQLTIVSTGVEKVDGVWVWTAKAQPAEGHNHA